MTNFDLKEILSNIKTKIFSFFKTFHLKKLLKQSHKILGLLFCIPIVIIGVTGAILVYENELSRLEMSFLERDKQGDVLSVEETLNRFIEQKPKAKLYDLIYTGEDKPLGVRTRFDKADVDPNDEFIFVAGDGIGQLGFYSISRYDGEILSVWSDKVFRAITFLHIALNYKEANETGHHIVAISTIVIMIISIIGLYLYFPMLKRNFSKSMKVDLKVKGYGFWYKLHSVTGVYTFIFVFIMCFSGLTFSYEWFRTLFRKAIGVEYLYQEKPEEIKPKEPKAIDIQEIVLVLETAKTQMKKNDSISISIPNMTNEPYTASYKNKDYWSYCGGHSLSIYMQTNKTIHKDSKDKPLNEQLACMGAFHSGQYFGETGKAIWCISSLSMALFGISGIVMFWRRRKKKTKKVV
jgi:sulfite reductase (NADPH) flavoprotein alpha-component